MLQPFATNSDIKLHILNISTRQRLSITIPCVFLKTKFFTIANTITVDEAFAQLGGFGLFQWLNYLGASIAEMAVTYQIFLLTFITTEPKWVCRNESVICNFSEPIGLADDVYKVRCDVQRTERIFADDFTPIVSKY